MLNGDQKGTCTNCIHKDICVYKKKLKEVQETVDRALPPDANDYLNPVKVTCRHWTWGQENQPTFR